MDVAVHKVLTDVENQQENPFNTSTGQKVVSEEENYWARKLRYGRTAYKLWMNQTLGSAGAIGTLSQFTPSVNKVFIPRVFTFSATVAVTLRFTYLPYSNYDTYDASGAEFLFSFNLPANSPFKHDFNGELEIYGNGGYIQIQITPQASSGTCECSVWGIEVSDRA